MQMADEEEDDEYERSGVTVPVADASDHKAAFLTSMANHAFLTPPSLPAPMIYPTSGAGVPTGQSIAGPGVIARCRLSVECINDSPNICMTPLSCCALSTTWRFLPRMTLSSCHGLRGIVIPSSQVGS